MKKLAMLVLCFGLTGCATGGGIDSGQITQKAKDIQNLTRTICAFVPTIQTVVSIINAGAGATIGIANDICAAITTVPLADGGSRSAKVHVNGRTIRLKGKFVR